METRGCGWLLMANGLEKIYYELHGKTLTIGYIKVGSGHRKKGYAKAGLQALLDHFPQVDKITTTTIRRTNKASVSLFKSLGFEFYVTKGNQWICKLTKPSLKSRRRPKKSNKDEDLVALLRRFEEVHFEILLDHTDHLPNRQKWAKSSIEPALEAYGDMAEDLATSPSSLKETEDRRAFHYFAMKNSLASMAKKGIIRRNLSKMNDLASLAYCEVGRVGVMGRVARLSSLPKNFLSPSLLSRRAFYRRPSISILLTCLAFGSFPLPLYTSTSSNSGARESGLFL